MKNFLHNLPSIIFSIIEGIAIFEIGILMQLKYNDILFIMIVFMLIRSSAEKPCHYKSIVKCVIFTMLLFSALFLVARVDFAISIGITVVSAYMLTEKGDIRHTFQHFNKKEEKKYRELEKYIQNNRKSKDLERFENILKNLNISYGKRYKYDFYKIYKLSFLENKTFEEIKSETGIRDNHGVTRALDVIFMSFNTYLETKKELSEMY